MSTQNNFLKQKYLNYKFVKCFENIDLYIIFITSQLLYSAETFDFSTYKTVWSGLAKPLDDTAQFPVRCISDCAWQGYGIL